MLRFQDTYFYRWMLRQARAAGRDLDKDAIVPGPVPLHRDLLVWAVTAIDNGLTTEQTASLAHGLGVTPEEVRAAYEPEMRANAMQEILSRPDLAALDHELDRIADDL